MFSPASYAAIFEEPTLLRNTYKSQLLPESSAGYRVAQAKVIASHHEGEEFLLEQNEPEGDKVLEFYFHGHLEQNGRLTLDLELVDHSHQVRSSIRGKQAFALMMSHVGVDNIEFVQSDWNIACNNHATFIRSLLDGKSPQQAAQSTWTGSELRNYGFGEVQRIWFESRSEQDTEAIRYEDIESTLNHYTVNVIFRADSGLLSQTELNGPLKQVWSADESELWLYDLVFGYRLGLRFHANHIEILQGLNVVDELGRHRPLTSLIEIIEHLNLQLQDSGPRTALEIEVDTQLLKALKNLRSMDRQNMLGSFQLSVLGKIFSKYDRLVEGISSQQLNYRLVFR
jgi:hypothetical protein